MSRAAKRHSRFTAFESLSPAGQAVVVEGLEKDWPQETIRMRLAEATGEDLSKGALSRFAPAWRIERAREEAAREQARRIVDGLRASNVEAGELGQALVFQSLLQITDERGELEADKIHALNIRYAHLENDRKELDLKRKALEVKEKALEVAQRRVSVLEGQIERVRTKARDIEAAASRFTEIPAELKAQVRELFGLASEEAHAA